MPNSPPSLQSLLEELYQTDPDLRAREHELIPLIQHLILLRPEGEPSELFKQRLQTHLLETHSSSLTPSFFQRMLSSLKQPYLALPIGALLIGGLIFTSLPSSRSSSTFPSSVFPANAITRNSAREAFGSLANAVHNNTNAPTANVVNGASEQALVMGGGIADKRIASSLIAPGFETTNYTYTYSGELPSWNAQMDVYKRLKGTEQNASLAQALARTTQNLVDLSGLNNLGVQSFTLSQATPYGYNVQVDLLESMITLSQNYREWPHPEAACKDEACFQRMRVKESDVPADDELLRIADEFLRTHGIDTQSYGTPVVANEWRRVYAETRDKASFFIPDIMTVVYPIKVNDRLVYDEGGMPHGLMVNVQIRDKRVESVSNLTSNHFESSAYQTEQDEQRIRSVMEKGGIYGFSYPEAKKTVEVALQNPEVVLQKIWMPVEAGQISNELLIPALRFEVKDKPENSYLPNYVLVPLVKEVLDQIRPGDIRIMM